MKKTKFLLILASAGMAAASLAACGQGGGSGGEGGGSKTISIWATFNTTYQAIIEKAIKKYEETYPGYKVEYTKYSGSYNDLASACVKGFSANNYPDMAVVYPDSVADFLMAGRAMNMKPYMTNKDYGWKEADIEDIPAGYLAESESYSSKALIPYQCVNPQKLCTTIVALSVLIYPYTMKPSMVVNH